MKQITAKQYAKIRPSCRFSTGTCGFPTSFSSTRFCTSWRMTASGARYRSSSENGTRSTPGSAAGPKAAFSRPFAALWEQQAVDDGTECFGLDNTGAREKSGSQSIGKSRGGWNTKIHIVSASDRLAMVFRPSGGRPTMRPKAAR